MACGLSVSLLPHLLTDRVHLCLLPEDLTPADGEVVSLETPLLPAASSAYSGFRAFVAGATGGTGRAIVSRLLQEGVPVRALVRDASAAVSAPARMHASMHACEAAQALHFPRSHAGTDQHRWLCAQVSILPAAAELYQGDVFQFASLQNALGDANVLFIATGSRPVLDPFGPFNIDFQVGTQGTDTQTCALQGNKAHPACVADAACVWQLHRAQ